jgi:hypothetical protein
MVTPVLALDSREQWRPASVDESMGKHGYTWKGDSWTRKGKAVSKLDLPPKLEPDKTLSLVWYHRVVEAGGLFWQQFWSWWPYNPKNYGPGKGWGEHEGDWEMVQLGCSDKAGTRPHLASYSQHGGCERREWWRVTLDDDGSPLVYVARDSHANYFAPEKDVTDTADGEGERLHPRVLGFGDWHKFTGKWGNSMNSPGPLTTRRAWRAPHAYHSQGR